VLLPVLAKQTPDAGPRTFGGAVRVLRCGALRVRSRRRWSRVRDWRVMLTGSGLVGLAELAIAPLHAAAVVGTHLFVCGLCFTTFISNSNARVQLGTRRPPAPRPR
jgi:hypothetical protein